MIIPSAIFVSNETHFAGEVHAPVLVAFLEEWIGATVPAEVPHAAGLKVQEVRVTRVMNRPEGKVIKVQVRHDPNEKSPVTTPVRKPVEVHPALIEAGFSKLPGEIEKRVPEHVRFRTSGGG